MDFAQDVGPNAETIVNDKGGKQSLIPFALDSCPLALADTWKAIDTLLSAGTSRSRLALAECGPCAEAIVSIAQHIMCLGMFDGQLERDESTIAAFYGRLPDIAGRLLLMLPDGPAAAMLEVGRVLHHGEQKYGAGNWLKILHREHLRHALAHLHAHMAGDRSEGDFGHLLRAVCRLWFAHEVGR